MCLLLIGACAVLLLGDVVRFVRCDAMRSCALSALRCDAMFCAFVCDSPMSFMIFHGSLMPNTTVAGCSSTGCSVCCWVQ